MEAAGAAVELTSFDWGADRYLADKVTVPPDGFATLARDFDAILVGAFGDPRVPSNIHAKEILLGMRIQDGPLRQCPSGALAGCVALSAQRHRTERHRFRRDSREHRGRLRRPRRHLQAGNARRSCDSGGHQHAQRRRAHHPLRVRVLREHEEAATARRGGEC